MPEAPQISDLQKEASKSSERDGIPTSFSFYDVFFWRDAPDWYRKTFLSAGFGLCYCALKQYLNRHELEVFMPPRSKVLPETMQEGYRNSQMLKYGFLKVGGEVTTIAGAAATYYAGAYYLGKYRGVHSYENFAVSGAAAGGAVALWLIRPFKARTTMFGVLLGGLLGAAGAYPTQYFGEPHWDESHDFEGYFLGSRINLKKKPSEGGSTAGAGQSPQAVEPGAASPATAAALRAAEATVSIFRGSASPQNQPPPSSSPTSHSTEAEAGLRQALGFEPSLDAQVKEAGSRDVRKNPWWRPW